MSFLVVIEVKGIPSGSSYAPLFDGKVLMESWPISVLEVPKADILGECLVDDRNVKQFHIAQFPKNMVTV